MGLQREAGAYATTVFKALLYLNGTCQRYIKIKMVMDKIRKVCFLWLFLFFHMAPNSPHDPLPSLEEFSVTCPCFVSKPRTDPQLKFQLQDEAMMWMTAVRPSSPNKSLYFTEGWLGIRKWFLRARSRRFSLG